MKNIFQILKENGIEIGEVDKEKEQAVLKAVGENYKTIADYEVQTGKLGKLEADLKTWQDNYNSVEEKLKTFDGVNLEELRGQITTLSQTVEDTKKDWEKKYSDRELKYNVDTFIKDKKFKYPEHGELYSGKIMAALEDKKNKGKSLDDILGEFIKDAEGNLRTDLFAEDKAKEPDNPNKLTIPNGVLPPSGSTPPVKTNPFAKATFNMEEQVKLFKENPAAARELAKEASYKLAE